MVFVIAIVAIIIYTFRDSAGPILKELSTTAPWVVITICGAGVMYNVVEGWINYSFAKQYNPQFTYRMGVESAFYCSFYRVATLGSGAGVAAVYYFNEKGIPVFQGTGMYMVEYAIHKVTIAIFSIIFFLLNFGFMKEHYSEYFNLLIAGYVLTAVIATALLLFCCSKKFHGILLFLVDKLNRKGKFDAQAAMLREQCGILEDAAGMLLTKGKLIASIVAKNLLKFAFCYGIPFVILYREYGLTLLQSWAVTSLAFMLAAVIPSPAGIGSSEFVFTALFTVLVGTGEAGSAALLYRFATFVLPFVIGGVVVLLHKRIDRRIAKRKADKAQQ
ncbi:flippase-like domain-containing protein [Roseburia sp. CLA-AA-H204]|uniref:Phosphatidylglycerol lysyltransferase n=1 Tax=Roseburia amylophila TaxID=2981794 RepID=A0AAW4WGY9_9FIRM|nr:MULTISPECIES: lysylphosphatidylglycerol synthase transmembrane domain-containing protein [Roseburia]MCC2243238.1 flippase-like domain-containing protein [Roseburia amylophila]MCU6715765.1 flippase-like domain-containing protein [Roseburia amylophila]MEE0549519.1 lysylphosphatidylglycerol synthase transmembrane domain-containing protein [Lachnospiraceae bacterium]